ncbi:hypothetical protein CR165_18070 [Pseudoroseomonas aestuarii]|uniref:YjiS-like domain-containing protein n=1 Tax=Teichococcus aestuarii TaxID=568898 RepID=A0A2U1V0D0_9PROT|nr:hypothetical protein CR165_18070 [Pseudoroseomonas aestuarii]
MVGAIFRLNRINVLSNAPVPRLRVLLALWHRRATTRAALRTLPPERLRDIGLSAPEAQREAARSFWEDGERRRRS